MTKYGARMLFGRVWQKIGGLGEQALDQIIITIIFAYSSASVAAISCNGCMV